MSSRNPSRPSIAGLGIALPDKRLTNADLERMVDTTDEWIRTRTGISERRIVENGVANSDLAAEATRRALKDAGLTPKDLDLIIVATISPDMIFPSTACFVQQKLGATCPAFDLGAACSGFPFALAVAHGFVESRLFKTVAVIGSEVLSKFIDWKDRSTCVLFGDGAGAAIVTATQSGHELVAHHLGSDGRYAQLLMCPAGGSSQPATEETVRNRLHFLKMEGSEIFKLAVRTMSDAIEQVLKQAGLRKEDVDCFIPHQANYRIIKAVGDYCGVSEDKIFVNVDRYGNMSSASTIVALAEAVQTGRIRPGSRVVLVAFGSGLTWASSLIKW